MDKSPVVKGVAKGGMGRAGGAGFTLFEVAISMLIVSFAVISVMMVFPIGLRQQQTVRFQILASTRALQLVDTFAGRESEERIADFELPRPWEGTGFCYSSTRWDLENHMVRWDSGIIPLPTEIARRLDTDGDEIQGVLDAGGMIYYADPGSVPSIDYRYRNPAPPNEAQKLVFAVVGMAQHNAITTFPYKAWPYRATYPSPPAYMGMGSQTFAAKEPCNGSIVYPVDLMEGWCNGDPGNGSLPSRDPKMVDVFRAFEAYWKKPNVMFNHDATSDQASRDLVKVVLAFCEDKFKGGHITEVSSLGSMAPPDEFARYIAVAPANDYTALGQAYDDEFAALCRRAETNPTKRGDLLGLSATRARMRAEIALRVQCFRFLAQAMTTFNQVSSSGFTPNPDKLSPRPRDNYGTSSSLGIRNLAAIEPINNIVISTQLLQYYHERCMNTIMRYAASFPYDFGAPRPVGRAIMMDQPLFEFDLFTPPHTGTITGTGIAAAMWRPLAAQAVTSPGMPAMYPGAMVGNNFKNDVSPFPAWSDRGPNRLWGDPRHFTLTRSFEACERCRQIVFWSVDWRSYEDAETAPSAPVDASRAPIRCLNKNDGAGGYRGRCYTGKAFNSPFDAFYIGNPERSLAFMDDVSSLNTGAVASKNLMHYTSAADQGDADHQNQYISKPEFFIGAYGADRNHNYLLDRGPVSSTQRLRAIPVARFNYYDPRIPIVSR